MHIKRLSPCPAAILLCLGAMFLMTNAASAEVPEWRGEAPGTDYLGPDVLWRTREEVVFHMQDPEGTGFSVSVTVRDMNVYAQGRRPALIWMVGPGGRTLFRKLLADDGVTGGNEQYRDGISDVYMDYRYREWHRVHSPGGRPPHKKRSPHLEHPEKLPPREVSFEVPAAGRGLYRLVLIGSWDHWFSVTPDRPIPTGVHPGPGPLYVHGDRLGEAYLYAPPGTREVAVALSEEIQPYNWKVALEEESGDQIGQTTPRTFFSYMIREVPESDAVYRLRVQGETTGACLSVSGLPFVACPDPETARAIHGGVEVDDRGGRTFHVDQRRLLAWADGLTQNDLTVEAQPPDLEGIREDDLRDVLEKVPEALEDQNIDPESEKFGRGDVSVLARAAGWDHPDNPYHGSAALVRRVLLQGAVTYLQDLNPFFWFAKTGQETPGTWSVPEDNLPWFFRSQWFAMHGARHVDNLLAVREVAPDVLPVEVMEAWKREYETWAVARTLMHQGICSNQWAASIAEVAKVVDATGSVAAGEVLQRQLDRITTLGGQGRVGPDPTPYSTKSEAAFTYAADSGYVGAGYAADGLGHDNEYCLETTSHLSRTWQRHRHQGVEDFLNHYYRLKTHLTMPKWGEIPPNTFAGTCSPSDMNARTGYYTHKSPLNDDLRERIRYGDIWKGRENPDFTWPCLEEGSFTRVFDERFFFIKTPGYYAIAHGGPAVYDFQNFKVAKLKDGSARLVGYGGMHYGGLQRKATKVGGISAVFVENCGPTLLAQNHNVMYSNVVWGRREEPVCEKWEEGHVDPRIVCSGFSHPEVSFDREGRVYRRTDRLRYAPLTVTRTVHYRDERIAVTLELLATDDLRLRELYECVPYFAEKRILWTFGADLDEGERFSMPEPFTSHDTHALPRPEERGENPDLPEVTFRAVDISADGGAGTAVIFDDEYEFTQTQPIRYRKVAAATGAFNLPLPARMEAGQKHVLRYVILSHQQPLEAERLREAAEEEGL